MMRLLLPRHRNTQACPRHRNTQAVTKNGWSGANAFCWRTNLNAFRHVICEVVALRGLLIGLDRGRSLVDCGKPLVRLAADKL